jgi:hypothetical protein
MGIQQADSAGKRRKDTQHGKKAWTCSIYMLHGMQHGEAALMQLTCSLDMQQGLAACTCSMDMQHEYAAKTCSMDRQH